MRKIEFLYLVILILTAIYANCITKGFIFDPNYGLYLDSSKAYFLHTIHDNTLFKNDLLTNSLWNLFDISKGMFLIYNILLSIFSLPIAIKTVSIISYVFSVIIMYKIGTSLYHYNNAYLLAGLFALYFLTMDSFYGGHGRALGVLMLCIFLLFFIKEKFIFLPFFIPLSVYFYFPVSGIFAMACIIIFIFFNNKLRQSNVHKIFLLVLIITIIAFGFLILNSHIFKAVLKNTSLIRGYKLQDYKYFQRLNKPIELFNPLDILLYFILNLNEHGNLYVYFTEFLIATCIIMIFFRKKAAFQLPLQIWTIMVSSVLVFIAIFKISPTFASRQFVFTVPLFIIFFLSSNLYIKKNNKIFINTLLAIMVSIFIILHPFFTGILSFKKYKPLYDYVESLPKDILIAGNPKSKLLNTIPFLSKRSIFFTDKLRDIFFLTYGYKEISLRRQYLIETLYSGAPNHLTNFISRYNIGYFIVEDSFYEKEFINSLKYSASPYDKSTYNIINNGKNFYDFILLEIAKKYADFKLEDNGSKIFVLSSEKIKAFK